MNKLFEIKASGSAFYLYPVDTCYGFLWFDEDEALEIPQRFPFQGEWGEALSTLILINDEFPMPFKLELMWLSIVEGNFYKIETDLPKMVMENLWEQYLDVFNDPMFTHVVVGMAPYGFVAIWLYGIAKSVLIQFEKGNKVVGSYIDFRPNVKFKSTKEKCEYYINFDSRIRENLEKNGLPPRDLFDNYMKQFTYRYHVKFGNWDEEKKVWGKDDKSSQTETSPNTQHPTPEFEYIEEALFDGTHDKLHDGGLMKYHEAGKPKKLAVQWHEGKKMWTAYFWFEDEEIRRVFDRFYGTHPDTKTDFMIRIDPEKNKYELALYRYGLREPQVIPEKAYQLLVFKNKFECFRSENYAQERGAWIW